MFYETFGLCINVAGVTYIFMNERHGTLLATDHRDMALYPNYFGQTCFSFLNKNGTVRCKNEELKNTERIAN